MRIEKLFILFFLLLLSSSLFRELYPQRVVSIVIDGKVTDDVTGLPIPGAQILFYDVTSFRLVKSTITDNDGTYEISVEDIIPVHTYELYVLHQKEENLYDYVPLRVPISVEASASRKTVDIFLTPGSTIVLTGDIRYVRSPNIYPATAFLVKVRRLEGEAVSESLGVEGLIDEFGSNSEYVRFLNISDTIVIVPSGIPVELYVKSVVPIERASGVQYYYYGFFEFIIDNDRKGFTLSQGESISISLPKHALKESFDLVKTEFTSLFDNLSRSERIGFYVASQKERAQQVGNLINVASEDYTTGKYTESISLLRIAYLKLAAIEKELGELIGIALTGSKLIPIFLGFFAIALGLITSEKRNRQFLLALIYFLIEIAVFYYIYPGSKVVELSEYFLYSIVSLLIPLSILLIYPKIYKEHTIYGRPPLKRLLIPLFSLAKRNIRRKKFRTLSIIVSLSIVIMAITVFTSVSRVQEIVTDEVSGTVPYSGILIRNPAIEGSILPYLPISPEDVTWLEGYEGVTKVSPKSESLPKEEPIGYLYFGEYSIPLRGIIGFSMSEDEFTGYLSQIMVSGKPPTMRGGSIAISKSLAEVYDLKEGDSLSLYVQVGVNRVFYRNFTISGIFSDDKISALKDIDSRPILPYYLEKNEETGGFEAVVCQPSQVIIMSYEDTLNLRERFKSLELITVSRILFQTSFGKEEDEFLRELIYSREYVAYKITPDKILYYHLGWHTEFSGLTVIFPTVIALLNVIATMLHLIEGRAKEIALLSTLGLNPTHIALLIIGESLTMGLIAGGIGYIVGLLTYQLFNIFSINLTIHPKLDWYWSIIALLITLVLSLFSAIKPAMNAILIAVPSSIRKISLPEEQKKKREEAITKTFAKREFPLPFKISENELNLFSSFVIDRLKRSSGFTRRIENVSFSKEVTEAGKIFEVKFTYIYGPYKAENSIVGLMKPGTDRYVISLVSVPEKGVPDKFIENIINFVKDTLFTYVGEKEKLLGG